MNAGRIELEANERLTNAYRTVRGLYADFFPGAYSAHENALNGEWRDRAGVTWGDFQRFIQGQEVPVSVCEKLVATAPEMLARIHTVSHTVAIKPSWALGVQSQNGGFSRG